ncbi:MAG: SUMF1/EgtB/PvdO family nonheme iron enzyme [Desulfobacterales bacterium]|nr:SUMF1/EgtB/PvdO family nonheme iron enzyme [Desulfobacterales bacterium]
MADTTPADKYIEFANDLGVVDTLGNVLEWTLDTCEPRYHRKSGSKYHIAKGGSLISTNDIRLFSRFKVDLASHSNILGFRCIVS